MTCSSCTHFTAKSASDATIQPAAEPLGAVGVCRRWPPRMTRNNSGHIASLFPNVHRAHACGEYQGVIPC